MFKPTNEQKKEKSDKRRQRLSDEEVLLIHMMLNNKIKPQVNVNLPASDPFILTPRNKK